MGHIAPHNPMTMNALVKRYKIAMDLGSHKVCTWITQETTGEDLVLLGWGHVASAGLNHGGITDVQALESALVSCLYEAQERCHMHISKISLTLSGCFFTSDYRTIHTSIPHDSVTPGDYKRLMSQIQDPHRMAIHIIPLDFTVDYQRNLVNPLGIAGSELEGTFHILWMDRGLFQTLNHCLKRCQLDIDTIVHAGYANGFSCITPDEKELGALVCDVGFDTTTVTLFSKGLLAETLTIPMGGRHVSQDIARGCALQLSSSERLKILHGAALGTPHDRRELLEIPANDRDHDKGDTSQDYALSLPRSFLVKIIQARYEELLLLVGDYLTTRGLTPLIQNIIFTGGGSQIPGLKELAHGILKLPIHIASPKLSLQDRGYPQAFSSLIGTLRCKSTTLERLMKGDKKSNNILSWIKEKYDTIMNR